MCTRGSLGLYCNCFLRKSTTNWKLALACSLNLLCLRPGASPTDLNNMTTTPPPHKKGDDLLKKDWKLVVVVKVQTFSIFHKFCTMFVRSLFSMWRARKVFKKKTSVTYEEGDESARSAEVAAALAPLVDGLAMKEEAGNWRMDGWMGEC